MIKRITCFAVIVLAALSVQESYAVSKNVSQIPNGSKFGCQNCHTSSIPALNQFGEDIQNGFYDASRNVIWNAQIAQMDSDEEGVTNGRELLDPEGVWRIGDPNPGNSDNVYNPGDPASFPDISVYERYDRMISPVTPNPAVTTATFNVSVERTGAFNAWIVSADGRIVKRFEEKILFAGVYPYEWDLRDDVGAKVASGVYSIIFHNSGRISMRQIVVLR